MKKIIVFYYLVTLSLSSFAITTDQLEAEFKEFFYSENISPRHCGNNIMSFLEILQRKGYSTHDIDIAKINGQRSMWGIGKILAVNSRFGRENDGNFIDIWYFHMIAIHHNKVYDFSFNRYPLILNVSDYLERMFIPHEPFMPYGAGFRIGGQGPHYTSDIANEELHKLRFNIDKYQGYGSFINLGQNLTTKAFVKRYGLESGSSSEKSNLD